MCITKEAILKFFGMSKEKSISILLGAGFSANKGYPVGNKLNNLLLNCNSDKFGFHTDGTLMISTDGTKPSVGYKTSYDFNFDFCAALLQLFNEKKGYFDYEEFYDFLKTDAETDNEVKQLANNFIGTHFSSVHDLVYACDNILNQLVSYFIKDENGQRYYDGEPFKIGDTYPGYTGIMTAIKEFSNKSTVHVHTLNHDLFFESFEHTQFLSGLLSDGFEEIGSPYYGKLKFEGRAFKCRIPHYTSKYDSPVRLYKLHGSFDYAPYHGTSGATMTAENYLKTRWGIGFSDFFKEKEVNGKLEYERDWVNYHADFLTGTTSKIQRYKEPLLFKRLFELFQKNLNECERLVIIGYGAKDSAVNKMLVENFDFKNKRSFIIDPFPSEKVHQLQNVLNAKLIIKDLNDITMGDFTS